MKVLTNEQMRALDVKTQSDYGISERSLMEEAGKAIARVALERFNPKLTVVLCGKGNNAGDGYVAARYLHHAGTDVKVVAVSDPNQLKGIAKEVYLEAAESGIEVVGLDQLQPTIEYADLIIDALCGIGIRGPLTGEFAEVARRISDLPLPILSVDVPSGVREIAAGEELGPAVQADVTIAIGAPKLCSVTLPGSLYTGELLVERINFPSELLDSDEWEYNVAPPAELRTWLPNRPLTANKGTFGKVGIVAGSAPYAGAAILAGRAALRAGAGLVYLFTTEHLNTIFKIAIPEAVSVIVPSRDPYWLDESSFEVIRQRALDLDALAVGMGLGTAVSQRELVCALLREINIPMVVDADGLTALGALTPLKLRPDIVLTPHPGEMARLLRCSVSKVQSDRIAVSQSLARQTGAHVLLKGADTVIARNDGQVWINSGACPSLAKGGSGDVLSGMIAALLAQGVEPWKAAILAARLHLEAGRACAQLRGEFGVFATEVADEIPRIIQQWLG
ncbi:MAG: NAD(P)H-hydrate dehydratase [Candidatus Sumerlaeaceae bacterium]|nr:NAD(P)H-hydrate dehydratase [Candidatus Sumerlaeaceae bacterium]